MRPFFFFALLCVSAALAQSATTIEQNREIANALTYYGDLIRAFPDAEEWLESMGKILRSTGIYDGFLLLSLSLFSLFAVWALFEVQRGELSILDFLGRMIITGFAVSLTVTTSGCQPVSRNAPQGTTVIGGCQLPTYFNPRRGINEVRGPESIIGTQMKLVWRGSNAYGARIAAYGIRQATPQMRQIANDAAFIYGALALGNTIASAGELVGGAGGIRAVISKTTPAGAIIGKLTEQLAALKSVMQKLQSAIFNTFVLGPMSLLLAYNFINIVSGVGVYLAYLLLMLAAPLLMMSGNVGTNVMINMAKGTVVFLLTPIIAGIMLAVAFTTTYNLPFMATTTLKEQEQLLGFNQENYSQNLAATNACITSALEYLRAEMTHQQNQANGIQTPPPVNLGTNPSYSRPIPLEEFSKPTNQATLIESLPNDPKGFRTWAQTWGVRLSDACEQRLDLVIAQTEQANDIQAVAARAQQGFYGHLIGAGLAMVIGIAILIGVVGLVNSLLGSFISQPRPNPLSGGSVSSSTPAASAINSTVFSQARQEASRSSGSAPAQNPSPNRVIGPRGRS